MIGRLFRRQPDQSDISSLLYGAIVAQARNPVLYRDFAVADSVDGRFEAIVLHTVVVLRRLRAGSEQARAAGQAIFDQFWLEMDQSLREMGVSDLAVPKRMRKLGEVYYGRAAACESALSGEAGKSLADVLARAIPAAEGREVDAGTLAAYIRATDAALAAAQDDALMRGDLPFVDPAAFVGAKDQEGEDGG